jgi:lipopolysaccharide export system protein LptC
MVGLLALATISGLLAMRAEKQQAVAAPRSAPLGVGYYLRDAELSGTGEDGKLRYRVTASAVNQVLADGSVALETVAIDYGRGAELPWNVRAATGRIPPDGKMIELTGNVVATTRDSDHPPATIRTDYLEFDPDTNVAATDKEVTIDYAGSTVHAIGMRALLREDRLELLSAVTGRYAP